jgi:integrase
MGDAAGQNAKGFKIPDLYDLILQTLALGDIPIRDSITQILQGFISWMVKNGHGDPLSFKPETPKYQRPLPTVPTSTDVMAILVHITDPMTRALIYLMWTTGARISTANQIRWENINWDSGTIMVVVKGGRPMLMPVPDEFRELMYPLRKQTGGVFLNAKTGNPI